MHYSTIQSKDGWFGLLEVGIIIDLLNLRLRISSPKNHDDTAFNKVVLGVSKSIKQFNEKISSQTQSSQQSDDKKSAQPTTPKATIREQVSSDWLDDLVARYTNQSFDEKIIQGHCLFRQHTEHLPNGQQEQQAWFNKIEQLLDDVNEMAGDNYDKTMLNELCIRATAYLIHYRNTNGEEAMLCLIIALFALQQYELCYEKALWLFQNATNADMKSQSADILGMLYENGFGVPKDWQTALGFYRYTDNYEYKLKELQPNKQSKPKKVKKQTTDVKKIKARAISCFGNKDYENALVHYQLLQETDPDNEHIALKIGHCYFELGQYQKAKEQYLPLIHSKNHDVVRIAKQKINDLLNNN